MSVNQELKMMNLNSKIMIQEPNQIKQIKNKQLMINQRLMKMNKKLMIYLKLKMKKKK